MQNRGCLRKIKKGDRKSKEQSEVFVNRIYNAREDFIELFSDYLNPDTEGKQSEY